MNTYTHIQDDDDYPNVLEVLPMESVACPHRVARYECWHMNGIDLARSLLEVSEQ